VPITLLLVFGIVFSVLAVAAALLAYFRKEDPSTYGILAAVLFEAAIMSWLSWADHYDIAQANRQNLARINAEKAP